MTALEETNGWQWRLVAPLKLRLKRHIRLVRQEMRGETWYAYHDPVNGRSYRFTPGAYRIIASLDGRRPLSEILEATKAQFGAEAPSVDDTLRLLKQLHEADALIGHSAPDLIELTSRAARIKRLALAQRLRSPLSIRIPLIDPHRILDRASIVGRIAFSRAGFLIWLIAVGYAAIEAGTYWNELTGNLVDRVLSAENLPLMMLAFVCSKLAHELGHGFAVKRWGGAVHEMGIMFLVFAPVPYVDASSSSAFQSKWQRAAVGAAGVYFEMLLAALALMLWLNVQPGLLHSLAFNLMFVASVSTLLFNANPLLRYDGYYVFSDLLGIVNLGSRANRYFMYLVKRWVLRLKDTPAPMLGRGERGWLVFYAIASFFYRLFIVALIALFLAQQYLFVGVLLAIWLLVNSIVLPAIKSAKFLATSPVLTGRRTRTVALCAGLVGAVGIVLFGIPAPLATMAQGIVWPPPRAEIAAQASGFVSKVLRADGERVCAGCPLMTLSDPELPAKIAALESRERALRAKYQADYTESMAKAQLTEREIEHVVAQLAEARDRNNRLTITSPFDGRFVVAVPEDLEGRFVRRGTIVGYAVREDELIVRAVVRQDDIGLINGQIERVGLRVAGSIDRLRSGSLERAVPSASSRLPSMALSTVGGGALALDPQDSQSRKALDRLFELQVGITGTRDGIRMGQRAHVQFVHGSEPVGWQLWRRARQLFLSRLNV